MLLTCRMSSVRKWKVLLAIMCMTPEMWGEKLNWELSSAVGSGEWAEPALINSSSQYHNQQCLCSGYFSAGGCCSLAVEVTHLPFSEGSGLIFSKCAIVKKKPWHATMMTWPAFVAVFPFWQCCREKCCTWKSCGWWLSRVGHLLAQPNMF